MRHIRWISLISCLVFAGPVAARGRVAIQAAVDGARAVLATFTVSGTVTDEGYFPLASADIDVRRAGQREKLDISGDNTDGSGAYAIHLPAGVYDISASGPAGSFYAAVTARSISVTTDTSVPNLALPPGYELRGLCQTASLQHVSGVDVDVDSLPLLRRLETKNDNTDTSGVFRVLVSTGNFRVTLSPPVAAKLLPVRYESIQITGPRDLGPITFPAGHWVSGRVVDAGSGLSIQDANLDFIRLTTGLHAITPGDLTDTTGFFRVVTDGDRYRLRVIPPSVQWDTLDVSPFGSLNDTTVTLRLNRSPVGVPPSRPPLRISLAPPAPNPARGVVTFAFRSPGACELTVCDAAGRRIANVFRGEAGSRTVRWSPRDAQGRALAPGVYLARLGDGRSSVCKPFAIVR